jgi:hypothetical protein
MSWFRLRPTFDIPLNQSREVVIERLVELQAQHPNRQLFLMFGEYGELHLPPQEHRLWSPHLSFYLMETDQKAVVHGRFAPRVDVWTVVWIAYLVFLFSAFFGLVLGISQWTLNETAWGVWVAVGAMVLWFSLFVVANIGQQWSSDQMQHLREQLESLLQQVVAKDSSSTGVLHTQSGAVRQA